MGHSTLQESDYGVAMQLLVKMQYKDQEMDVLVSNNEKLSSALSSAETRMAELYADQDRIEQDMASRLEIIEKLRSQV